MCGFTCGFICGLCGFTCGFTCGFICGLCGFWAKYGPASMLPSFPTGQIFSSQLAVANSYWFSLASESSAKSEPKLSSSSSTNSCASKTLFSRSIDGSWFVPSRSFWPKNTFCWFETTFYQSNENTIKISISLVADLNRRRIFLYILNVEHAEKSTPIEIIRLGNGIFITRWLFQSTKILPDSTCSSYKLLASQVMIAHSTTNAKQIYKIEFFIHFTFKFRFW